MTDTKTSSPDARFSSIVFPSPDDLAAWDSMTLAEQTAHLNASLDAASESEPQAPEPLATVVDRVRGRTVDDPKT